MIEVRLEFLQELLHPITISHAEALLDLTCGDQVRLEHLEVPAEPGHLLCQNIHFFAFHRAYHLILLIQELLNGAIFTSQGSWRR